MSRGEAMQPDHERLDVYHLALDFLDVCFRLALLDEVGREAGKAMLVRIVSMLVKLAQAWEES
jgi:hypothetical protein